MSNKYVLANEEALRKFGESMKRKEAKRKAAREAREKAAAARAAAKKKAATKKKAAKKKAATKKKAAKKKAATKITPERAFRHTRKKKKRAKGDKRAAGPKKGRTVIAGKNSSKGLLEVCTYLANQQGPVYRPVYGQVPGPQPPRGTVPRRAYCETMEKLQEAEDRIRALKQDAIASHAARVIRRRTAQKNMEKARAAAREEVLRQYVCAVCWENKVLKGGAVLNPCGHALCKDCADKLAKSTGQCPKCRTKIQSVIRLFI